VKYDMPSQPFTINRTVTNPIQASKFRFAPMRDGRLATLMWRIWVERNEVYAMSRVGKGIARFSFHYSGQIHQHLGQGKKQIIQRPMLLPEGTWMHQIEWRFLIGPDVLHPPTETLKPDEKAYLLNVPPDHMLMLNLLIAAQPSKEAPAIPQQFAGATISWQARLDAGHHVILVGRLTDIDELNKEHLRYIRHELNPHANLDSVTPTPPYVEIHRLDWSEHGGNAMLIVPMGHEGYRVPSDERTDKGRL
jgi:hypothetical protein